MNPPIAATFALGVLSLVVAAPSAQAGQIYFGISPDAGTPANPAGVQTRYKISSTNWDAMLGNGVVVDTSNITSRDLGNNSLSGKQYNYTVVNLVGKGLYYKLTPLTGGGNTVVSSWGNISALDIAGGFTPGQWTNVATLGGVAPQTTPYNALHLYAQASSSGDQVDYSNVSFNINTPGITTTGTLPTSGQAKFGVQTVSDSYIAYFNDDNSAGDLASVGWSFSADVTVTRGAASGSGESAKFEFTGKTMTYTPPASPTAAVPETSTWVMGLLALGTAIVVMRRRAAHA